MVFGVGFAFSGYCPATGAAAIGQGDLLAIVFMFGLVVGSYLYAECSAFLKLTIDTWGDKGKMTLNMLFHLNKGPVVAIFSIAILCAIVFLDKFTPS